jgi:hypothetical protein
MTRRFSVQYIDRLLNGCEYQQLAEISSIICSSSRFSPSASDWGLPPPAFVFVETLCWFAQAIRSGVWTYFEATPQSRQTAMAKVLREFAPPGFADSYERGMADRRDEEKMSALKKWIVANDKLASKWLREVAIEIRPIIIELAA